MQIDYEKSKDKTGTDGISDHAAPAGLNVRKPDEPPKSDIAKLIVWPKPEPTQSQKLLEEMKQHSSRPKRNAHDVRCVPEGSRLPKPTLKNRLIRMSILVVVLTSAVMITFFAVPSLGDFGLKRVLYRVLSSVVSSKGGMKMGQVTGIIYSDDKPSAVIGNSLVHEGDILYGVEIVKINFNNVEFERNGLAWSQRLREKPPKHWSNPPLNSTPQ